MLEFLIDDIFVVAGGQIFQQFVGITIGTNCARLSEDLVLNSHEAIHIQKLLQEKKQNSLWPSIRHFDTSTTFLPINKDKFHLYVNSIHPNELELKDTTE
jgi:hypothetical protein